MKKVFTALTGMLCAFFFSFTMTAQQTHKMQINLRSGEVVEYLTEEVQNVTFTEVAVSDEFSATFNVIELTQSSVSVTVTPSNNAEYFAMLIAKGWIINPDGSYLSDKEIIESFIYDPNYEDRSYTGTQTLSGENYKPGTQLTVIAFDAAARNNTSGYEVFKQDITIQSGDVKDQFIISNLVPGTTDVSFHVQADDASKAFIAVALEKTYFDKYVANGEEMMRFYYILNNESTIYPMSQYVTDNCKYGEGDFTFTKAAGVDMKPNIEYIVAVFYVDPTNDDVYNYYDWNYTYEAFTTIEAASAPTIELTNPSKAASTQYPGYYDVSCTINTTNAATIYCTAKPASQVEPYLDDLASSSNSFFGWTPLSSSAVEQANGSGYNWSVAGAIESGDHYIIALAIDADGGRTATAVKIP